MEYDVIEATELDDLKNRVIEKINQGWIPQGGVSVTAWDEQWENSRNGYTESETYTIFVQAMIKPL